ncbi:Nucleoside-diphosphate-sugar epimerase [Pandoraea eparura]|jgi:nucleoside-diphosphate-sugar epimerase|uniref:Nucleoside-diphosphate-sugar epimerase n=1 Tax=Pandoraea eparura TaxID=2508291 RepID=A0A5E4TVT8_9BURK|nr:NAD-dependent epimerase/dehydratase family protein [Pandoraea eparura]VVD91303.1 Nucleoside-diphosphate-sugar epimerase [Pandoraea eparura]
MAHESPYNVSRALVLGATGGIGGEVARQLLAAGWHVRALRRGGAPHVGASPNGIEWRDGDAMHTSDVLAAARDCEVIVHAVNPPGYRHWDTQVMPMLENTLAAATLNGATIVLPGTVYNYGPETFPVLHDDAPQHPRTRKGRIRATMEGRLRDASRKGVRTIIVRAGDFFGPQAGNSWFGQGLVKPGRTTRVVRVPNAHGVGHQWSYLPDVGRAMVMLIERRHTLDDFANFHMAGHWDTDGTQMAAAIARVMAQHGVDVTTRRFPWWLVWAASPFVTTLRELREMRYLWRQSVRMDNTRLVATLGQEPHTPLDVAIGATLEGLGCLPGGPHSDRSVRSSAAQGTSQWMPGVAGAIGDARARDD